MTEYYETLQELIDGGTEKESKPRSLAELISYPGELEEKLSMMEERLRLIGDQYDRIFYYQQELLRALKNS